MYPLQLCVFLGWLSRFKSMPATQQPVSNSNLVSCLSLPLLHYLGHCQSPSRAYKTRELWSASICSGAPLNLTCEKASKEHANDEAVMTDVQPYKSREEGVRRHWPLPEKHNYSSGLSHQKTYCSHYPLNQTSFCPWMYSLGHFFTAACFHLWAVLFVFLFFMRTFTSFSASLLSIWAYFYSSTAGESPCL